MEFSILGPLEVRGDGDRPLELGGRKQRALLAVLLLHANRVLSSGNLIEALWGDSPPETAPTALQGYVSHLRKALAPAAAIVTRAPGYVLELEEEELDLNRFERIVEEARRAAAEGDAAKAAGQLREALALWRGPALGDLADEPFARAEALRLEELRLAAFEERIEADLRLGRHATLVGELETYVAQQPLRERPRAQLMLALYRSGRQAEALAAYREARRVLVDELGIEPGRELQELEQAILRHDPALDLRSDPAEDLAGEPDSATVDKPLLRPTEMREERKVVSVLFVDLVDFTSGAELADPEDVRATLRPFHSAVREAIERHGGTVEKFIGDAVMAVFGAPATHEDDAERAVRAALAIRRWVTEDEKGLRVRMGVNSGVAIVALDARPLEGEPLATGDVVNTAQRLQTGASANGILVGEPTYRATRHAIDYREITPVEAKGKSQPIRAWEPLGPRSKRADDLPDLARTPFFGRRTEVDLLTSALARVLSHRSPQLVTLVGVPGIGKSRLVFELFSHLEQEGEAVTWLQGRCPSYGDGVSFWALGEIVKAQVGILEADSSVEAAEKLQRAVDDLAAEPSEARWIEQQLRPLVGLAGEPSMDEHPGAGFAAWRRFLECAAEARPLVLVFEDLHWADDGLLEFVDELADRLRYAPVLLLCTARPELLERRADWGGGKANALTISLGPLSDEEMSVLVDAVLEQPLAESMGERLVVRAAGNPLYAEQFARVLAEGGSFEELPETVHAIVAARLDSLRWPEKALLQAAAVVGNVFWLSAIESVGDISSKQAEELLVALERKEFVQRAGRSSVAGDAEYAFGHSLIRDVAYGEIPRAARAEKHRRAAEWLETFGPLEDRAEMLAHHYVRALEYISATGGEDPAIVERARVALRAAGDRALGVASYASAAHFYSAALGLWPEQDPDRVWVLVQAGRASHAADGTGVDRLEQGFAELLRRGDAGGAAEVAVELGRRLWTGGDRDSAHRYIDRALDLTKSRRRSRARAYALVERAAYHLNAIEDSQAVRLAREALPLIERLGLDELRVRALDVLGTARVSSGDIGGVEDSQRAIALARKSNSFSRLIWAEYNLRATHIFLGQLDAASKVLAELQRDVESYGSADQRKAASITQAHEAVLHGRWREAGKIVDGLIADAEAGALHYLDPAWQALHAVVSLARGDLGAASTGSAKALDRARVTKDAQLLVPALALRGIVLRSQGRLDEASALASESLEWGSTLLTALLESQPTVTPIEFSWLVRDLGRESELLPALEAALSTPWVEASRAIAQAEFTRSVELVGRIGAASAEAYARLRAAEELARAGRRQEAHDLLAPALDFFRKVGAKRWLEKGEELLARRALDRAQIDHR
jgi:DNA-binding SARP family transcriptional activator